MRKIALLGGAIVLWLMGGSLFGAVPAETPTCSAPLVAFDTLWKSSFLLTPGPVSLKHWLSERLKDRGTPPLSEIHRGLVLALREIYKEKVETARLPAETRGELLRALDLAVGDLVSQNSGAFFPPQASLNLGSGGAFGDGGGGDGGEDGSDDFFSGQMRKHLKESAFRKCLSQTSILLGVSSLVTAAGAVIVNWERYAESNRSALDFLRSGDFFLLETWKKAWSDPEFRHINSWNIFLMLSLGGVTCMSDRDAGRNLFTAISGGTSLIDQYANTGNISLRQTFIDVFWMRYISFWKTSQVFRLSRSYQDAGLVFPRVFEGTLQFFSESIGGFGYPWANNFSKQSLNQMGIPDVTLNSFISSVAEFLPRARTSRPSANEAP